MPESWRCPQLHTKLLLPKGGFIPDESFTPALAEAAGMSVSTFLHNFKEVTAPAPLQYVKTIRLHKARSLMLYEGATASEAPFTVGYASPSQFSREFRRLFGLPPSEEISWMKASEEAMETEVG